MAIAVASCACTPAHADRASDDGKAVLAKYCVRCHGPRRAESDFGFANDTDRLVASGFVLAGDPDGSPIVRRIEHGEMPPEGPRPSAAEVRALRSWIGAMTKPDAHAPARDDAVLERTLAADAARLDDDTRENSRWLSLAHLANAGTPATQLDGYRSALAVLLTSLTWAPAPNALTAIDPERTLFRIDLRELGWTAATWDTIRATYPYGVARSRGVPDYVRADWFVATASRGSLYYAILGLPDREHLLAQLLGVDLDADRAAANVVRAGFSSSGVSVNNRVIERHPTKYGAYWRSFDFGSSVGFENIFKHPLDFVPAGGEIIFNLPDGMQAYLLVDKAGHRLDKAPTAIVSDPRRPDRSVENALSCIGCHGAGIVERADQLRESTTDSRVQRLYVPPDELTKHYATDRARFATALDGLGLTPNADPATEPVTLLTAQYEAELDVRIAAAELGLAPAELRSRIAGSKLARRDLAALTVSGGTLKRDAWVVAFPRMVSEFGLGVPFTPRAAAELGPTVWIDRQRNTWIALDTAVDRPTAERACRTAGASLPRTNEVVSAATQGLAGSTRLATQVWTQERKLDAANQRYSVVVDLALATTSRASPNARHATVCIHRRSEIKP